MHGQYLTRAVAAMDSGFALVSTQIRVTTAHAVRLPANSSHMCCLELALKGVLCPVDDPQAVWLPLPGGYGCAHA